MYTPKLENDLSVLEINYLVGTPAEVSYFKERHELGLFQNQNLSSDSIRCQGTEKYISRDYMLTSIR